MNQDILNCVNDIYEQPWWLELVAEGKWHVAEVIERDEVLARMPYRLEKNIWGNKIVMPVQTQTLGPWIKANNQLLPYKRLSLEKEIINQLLDQLPKHYYLKLMLDHSNSYLLPYYWRGYKIVPRYSYRIKDLSDISQIYSNFGRNIKGPIKQAQKKVEVVNDYNFERIFKLLELTYEKQNRKYSADKTVLKRIMDGCHENGAGKMLSAIDHEGNVHSCAYFIFDKKVCYFFKAGNDPLYRSSGASSLLIWEGIKLASAVAKEFDFEGSMVEGIENFFRGFGGELNTYYEIQKMPLIFEFWESCKPRLKRVLGYKI